MRAFFVWWAYVFPQAFLVNGLDVGIYQCSELLPHPKFIFQCHFLVKKRLDANSAVGESDDVKAICVSNRKWANCQEDKKACSDAKQTLKVKDQNKLYMKDKECMRERKNENKECPQKPDLLACPIEKSSTSAERSLCLYKRSDTAGTTYKLIDDSAVKQDIFEKVQNNQIIAPSDGYGRDKDVKWSVAGAGDCTANIKTTPDSTGTDQTLIIFRKY